MIRWKHPRDLPGIVRLVRTELLPISSWQLSRDVRLHDHVARRLRRGATLVAARSRADGPFAFLHMEFRRSTLFIDLLAVDPRHRSRRWGTRLMERAETVGKKKGCILSRVYVDEHNNRAIRFYERCGYRLIRHLPALRIVEMAKPLAHGELADYA